MNPSLLAYADEVWRGEHLDDPACVRRFGSGMHDVVDGVGLFFGFGNSIAFRAGDGLVLFDTSHRVAAGRLHASVREWDGAPVDTIVFSHGHFDHVGGTGPFDGEGRRPTVVAHEKVGERFERYALTQGYNTIINDRQFRGLGVGDQLFGSFRLPDVTYRDALTVTRGGWTAELRHVRGETDDHTFAWLPHLRLLCPGDMFIWLSPNCGNPQKVQRYPREWAIALRRMAALGAEIMLPSHGAPVFGADRVRQALTETAEWLESLVEQALDAMNGGARLNDILHTVRPPARLADRPYLRPRYDEPEFVVRSVWRLYGGWYDGNPANLKPARDTHLAEAIARLAGGPRSLADAALRHLDAGDHRVAGHFAELAVLAAPDDPRAHEVRATVYRARAEVETSLMAKGIFGSAADESAARAGTP